MDPYQTVVSGIQFQDLQIEANTKRVDGVSDKSDNNKGDFVSNMKLLILQELKSFRGEHETYIDLCRKLLNFPCSPTEKSLQMQSLETRTSEAKAYEREVVSGLSNKERLVHLLEDVKNEKRRVQQDIFNAKKDLKDEEKQQKKNQQKQDKSKKKKK